MASLFSKLLGVCLLNEQADKQHHLAVKTSSEHVKLRARLVLRSEHAVDLKTRQRPIKIVRIWKQEVINTDRLHIGNEVKRVLHQRDCSLQASGAAVAAVACEDVHPVRSELKRQTC
eukprot:6492268-Amphidinium_carterae.2